jgi:hypothetical protein
MEHITRRRFGWLIAGLVVASISLSSAAPLGAKNAKPVAAPEGNVNTCRLADPPMQPALPLELNTIARDGLFKTVAMEKEVFICGTAAAPDTIIRDVETFIEAVELNKGQQIEWRTEIATCNKNFQTGVVQCRTKQLPLPTIDVPLQGCQPLQLANRQPLDPVEMNTVTTIGTDHREYVKTVKVEKEILACESPNAQIGENYLFTEIIEMRAIIAGTNTQTYRPALRQFFGVFCRKNVPLGTIVSCGRYKAG